MSEHRFDRIEEKLDKLSDAMISLARTEEKILAMERDRSSQTQRLNRFSEKLDTIEKKVDESTKTINILNKLFWVGVVAFAGAYAMQMLA